MTVDGSMAAAISMSAEGDMTGSQMSRMSSEEQIPSMEPANLEYWVLDSERPNGTIPLRDLRKPLVRMSLEGADQQVNLWYLRVHNHRHCMVESSENTFGLLDKVCEKVMHLKRTREEEEFTVHQSDIYILCRIFGTNVEQGFCPKVLCNLMEKDHDKRKLDEIKRSVPSKMSITKRVNAFWSKSDFPLPKEIWWTAINTKKLKPTYEVVRNNTIGAVTSSEIFPGDIIHLSAGQRVGNDVRVLVHSDGTLISARNVTRRANDILICDARATHELANKSRNIIVKNSIILYGSIICMAVGRANEITGSQENDSMNTNLPINTEPIPGISSKISRTLFKAMAIECGVILKSFAMMHFLAQASIFIIPLTTSLGVCQGYTSLMSTFCNTVNKLGKGKTVILVNVDWNVNDVNRLAGALESVAFFSMTKGPDVKDKKNMRQKSSLDHLLSRWNTGAQEKDKDPEGPAVPPQAYEMCSQHMIHRLTTEENRQLNSLVTEIRKNRSRTIIIRDPIPETLHAHLVRCLKQEVAEMGLLAYVASEFNLPRVFSLMMSPLEKKDFPGSARREPVRSDLKCHMKWVSNSTRADTTTFPSMRESRETSIASSLTSWSSFLPKSNSQRSVVPIYEDDVEDLNPPRSSSSNTQVRPTPRPSQLSTDIRPTPRPSQLSTDSGDKKPQELADEKNEAEDPGKRWKKWIVPVSKSANYPFRPDVLISLIPSPTAVGMLFDEADCVSLSLDVTLLGKALEKLQSKIGPQAEKARERAARQRAAGVQGPREEEMTFGRQIARVLGMGLV